MPCSLRLRLTVSGEPGKLDISFNSKAPRKGWFSASLTMIAFSPVVEMCADQELQDSRLALFSKNNLAHLLAVVNGTPIVLAALDAE